MGAECFEKAAAFLDSHPEMDVVSCRHCYFGKEEGFNHYLDYKFDRERVVNILEDYTTSKWRLMRCLSAQRH